MPINQTQAELDEARSAGAAACIFAILIYVFGFVVMCRRRCCNAKLGFGKGCCSNSCDGRMCSRRWGRVACAVFACVVLALAVSVIVFFTKFPWTVQYQTVSNACSDAVTSTDPFEPCGLSYKVFYLTVFAYSWLGVVLLLSWGSCVWMCPLGTCFPKMYDAYVCDDGFEVEGLLTSRYDDGDYTWVRTPQGEFVVEEKKKKPQLMKSSPTRGMYYTPIRVPSPRRLTWNENVEYYTPHNPDTPHG